MLDPVIVLGRPRGLSGCVRREGSLVNSTAPIRHLTEQDGDFEGGPQNSYPLYGLQSGYPTDMALDTMRSPTVGLLQAHGRGVGGCVRRGGSSVQ